MIKLENVTKYYPTPYGRKYVLRDVNLTIPAGVNVAILGINGSGKSTLLRLLGGIDTPSSGKISIDMNISWPIGLAGGLQRSLSGRDNAKFVCRIFGDNYKQMRERVTAIEGYAELGKYFDMPVNTYSSGMASKLKLAISTAFEFDCYLFDELGAVGDALFRKKTQTIFAERSNRANFIIVSHNINELIHDCNIAVVLHNEKLMKFDSVLEGVQYYYEVSGVKVKHKILDKLGNIQRNKLRKKIKKRLRRKLERKLETISDEKEKQVFKKRFEKTLNKRVERRVNIFLKKLNENSDTNKQV